MRKPVTNMALAIAAGLIVGSVSVMAAEKTQTAPAVVYNASLATTSNGTAVWVAVGNVVKKCRELEPGERQYSTIPEVRCIYAN